MNEIKRSLTEKHFKFQENQQNIYDRQRDKDVSIYILI